MIKTIQGKKPFLCEEDSPEDSSFHVFLGPPNTFFKDFALEFSQMLILV